MSTASDARVTGGHVIVRTRALERVFTALAADALGVAVKTVTVKVTDERGSLGVEVRSPFAVGRAATVGAAGSDGAATVIDVAERVRDRVQTDGAHLTGARIAQVRVRITDTTTTTRRVS